MRANRWGLDNVSPATVEKRAATTERPVMPFEQGLR